MKPVCGILGVVCAVALGTAHAAAESGDAGAGTIVVSADVERIRSVTNEVLSTPEFARLRTVSASWWRSAWDWLRDGLRAIPRFFGSLPSWLFWMLFIWMLLALVAILVHLVWTLVQLLRGGGGSAAGRGADAEYGAILGVRDLEFGRVYQQAHMYLQAGDWPQAMRYLYVAAILWLDSVDAIAFHGSKTDRDYLRELSRRPGQRARFSELTQVFERCVYGVEAPSEAACTRMADTVKALRHEATSPQQDR